MAFPGVPSARDQENQWTGVLIDGLPDWCVLGPVRHNNGPALQRWADTGFGGVGDAEHLQRVHFLVPDRRQRQIGIALAVRVGLDSFAQAADLDDHTG